MIRYITNLRFTIQHQIPQKSISTSHNRKIFHQVDLPGKTWNKISVMLNSSVTSLKLTIDSKRSKNKVATTSESYFPEQSQGWNMDAQRTECVVVALYVWCYVYKQIYILSQVYTGCIRRTVRDFGRVFLMLNYTDIPQNTYIQSWAVTEVMAGEVWKFDSCYSPIDYHIHIETGMSMCFL